MWEMRVTQIGSDFWRVADGNRWWIAKSVANFGMRYWHITNSRGMVIASSGPTGRRVIAAIREGVSDREDQ